MFWPIFFALLRATAASAEAGDAPVHAPASGPSAFPGAALDSLAVVDCGLRGFEDAAAELNAALDLDPGLFVQGVIRKWVGDAETGEGDPVAARLMAPRIDRPYPEYGVVP